MPEETSGIARARSGDANYGPGTGGAGLAVVSGEQVFYHCAKAFVFLGIEVGVFKEIQVAGEANAFDFAEYAEGVETESFEFFTGGGWKHGRII